MQPVLDVQGVMVGAIPGAPAVLGYLREVSWEVALATGGWAPSARLKLVASGERARRLPAAGASVVIQDLADALAILTALEEAAPAL